MKELDKVLRQAGLVGFEFAKAQPNSTGKEFLKWWDSFPQSFPKQQLKIQTKRSIKAK